MCVASLVVSGEGSTWCTPVLWSRVQVLGHHLHTDAAEGLTLRTSNVSIQYLVCWFSCVISVQASPQPCVLTPLMASLGLCQGCSWVCWGCSSFWQQDIGFLLPLNSPGVGNTQSHPSDSCLCNSGAVSSQRTAVSIRHFTWRY